MISPRRPIEPADVAGHYNELDAIYRKVWSEHVHHGLWTTGREDVDTAVRNLALRVAVALELRSGDRVCDVGCGYGATSRMFAAELGARVTGVTLSQSQYEYAVARAADENPRFICGDFLENPFEAASFDAAFAIESTEHFVDKPRLFAEIARILRPGGRLAVCAWLAGDAPGPRQTRHLLEPICSEGRLPGLGSEADYRALLDRAGFRDVRFDDVTRNVARTWGTIVRRVLARLPWDVSTWRYLLGSPQHAIFAVTIPRILMAYRTGAMRYGIFAARKSVE